MVAKRRLAFGNADRLHSGVRGSNGKNISIKEAAAEVVRELPDIATWDDVIDAMIVRQKIDAGLADLEGSLKHSHGSIREEFGVA